MQRFSSAETLNVGDYRLMRQALENDEVVIIDRGVAPELVASLRRSIWRWVSRVQPLQQGVRVSRPDENFHRLDDGSRYSDPAHKVHVIGFGASEELPGQLRSGVQAVSSSLLELGTRVTGVRFSWADAGVRVMVLKFPRGGGFAKAHSHPVLPMVIQIALVMSEYGTDHEQGGAMVFDRSDGWLHLAPTLRPGDAFIMPAGMPHAFARVDPDAEFHEHDDEMKSYNPGFDDSTGFWLLSCEHWETDTIPLAAGDQPTIGQ